MNHISQQRGRPGTHHYRHIVIPSGCFFRVQDSLPLFPVVAGLAQTLTTFTILVVRAHMVDSFQKRLYLRSLIRILHVINLHHAHRTYHLLPLSLLHEDVASFPGFSCLQFLIACKNEGSKTGGKGGL